MNLKEYARMELKGWIESDDEMDKQMAADILEIVDLFADQHHTGFTAPFAIKILGRLLAFKPLSPLTGDEDEWQQIGEENWQNKRDFSVFKDEDGRAYKVDAKVFSDDGGATWYTCKESREYIEFPYVVPDEPKRVILNDKKE